MAEKIEIAEFNLDIEQLTQAAADTLKAIQEIKEEQKQLVKEGRQTDQAFVRNAVNLRGLQKEYNAQIKVVDQYMNASNKNLSITQRVDAAMKREGTTIKDLREQNKQLTAVRNDVNLETEEGQKLIAQLNAQLDKNNDLIKENVSELEQQKIGIGGYADGIRDALGETGLFNDELGTVTSVMEKLSPITTDLSNQLKSATEGFRTATAGTQGMTVAQKAATVATNLTSASLKLLKVALIGTGIGAIVVLLGSLVAYLTSSEQAGNRFSKILKTVGGMVKNLIQYLEPLGELLMDGIEAGFRAVGAIAEKTFKILASGLEMLGFDNAAKNVRTFTDDMKESAKTAADLADREAKLAEENRKSELIMKSYQKEAEKLRQIRDNENLSIAERQAANEKLGKTLQEQMKVEKDIAVQALTYINLQIAAYGRKTELLDQQAEAMARVEDITERITSQESEQLTNRISLQKEAAAQAKEAAEAEKTRRQENIERMRLEQDLYEAQTEIKARSLEEQFQLELDYATRRRAIIDKEFKDKLISQTEYNLAVQELENDLALKRAELAAENLERELSTIEDRIAVEQAVSTAVGMAKVREEQRQEEILREARAKFQQDRFDQGLISEQEYEDEVLKIRNDYMIREAELQKEMRELQKEERLNQEQLDFEEQLASLEERENAVYEIQRLQIERQREMDIQAARDKYTDEAQLAQAILTINQQAATAMQQVDKAYTEAKWQSYADLAGSLAQLLGEETIAGKAAAIAQATINTYLGATKALATLPPPMSWIAAGTTIASGLASVAKITGIGTPKTSINTSRNGGQQSEIPAVSINSIAPYATGGKVKGGIRIRRSNGDNILATLKTGEVVLNSRQQQALGGESTFRRIGVPGFASGGIAGGNTATVQSSLFRTIDDSMAEAIGMAVQNGARQGTEAGARQGIVDASAENYIRNLSTF